MEVRTEPKAGDGDLGEEMRRGVGGGFTGTQTDRRPAVPSRADPPLLSSSHLRAREPG